MQNWGVIYNGNIDSAHNELLIIIRRLYDKNGPKNPKTKQKTKICSSSMDHKGLQNTCKKKNTHYGEFIRQRTKESENKFLKKSKNKLIF